MFRAFLQNVVHAFRQNPLKAAASLLSVLETHPVVVFQAAVFLRFPTLASAAMFVLGSLANQLFVNLFIVFRGARTWMLLRAEVTSTFREFTFQSVPADLYLGADYSDMDFWLVKKFRGPSATLNDTVSVYVLRKPGSVVSNLVSYSVPLGDAHVFLTEEPGSLRGVRRYQVLHEIGHALMGTTTSSAFVDVGIAAGIYFLFWFAGTTEWSVHALAGALAYAAVLVIWRSEIQRHRQLGRLTDEMVADGLAVGYLSPEDARAAADSPFLSHLKDKELSDLHNAIRSARLREMFELRAAGEDVRIFELSIADLPQLTLAACLPAILLVGVMGVYATTPTGETVAWTGALTGVLFLLFLFLALSRGALLGALAHELQARTVPPAEMPAA
jgi:hypothetical protein